MFVCPVPKISQVMVKWRRRASYLGRFTLWHNGCRATQLVNLLCERISDLSKPLKDERRGHKNHHELARQSGAKLKQAPQSEANGCRRRGTKMQSQKNLPY